ncbi:hypothetical protein JXJ21_26370 [candidate division KSB1 bacterium]|nr:hypothetical protein [candidate division KSB1 bacterium]
MMTRIKFISLFAIIVGVAYSSARLGANPPERLKLVFAREFNQRSVEGEQIQELAGDVHFQQGNAHLYCQKAIYYRSRERLLLEKRVKIDDGTKILLADFVTYDGRLKYEEARGHVKIIDSVQTLNADKVIFYEIEDKAIADQNVKITDTANSVILTGGHAEYFRSIDSIHVTIDPVMTKLDSSGKLDIRITGKAMTLIENGARALVKENVRINKDSTEAHCGEAEYIRELNKFILRDQPHVWQKRQELFGDTIEIYIKDQFLEQVHVSGNANIISDVDSLILPHRKDRLSGQRMEIFSPENEIEKIIIENQATSWYHVVEDGSYKGLNKVIGDKLSLFIAGNEIKRILIESNPSVSSGIFYPPGHEKYPEDEKGTKAAPESGRRPPSREKES